MTKYIPRIVGFLCNWCSYAGADLAGVSRFQYSADIRIARVMCSGRLDPCTLLETLLKGADGVFVGGCHIGDCHYISGNHYTGPRIEAVQNLMAHAGLEPTRLRLEWVSAAEGHRFAGLINEFTRNIRDLGPSPLRNTGSEKMRRKMAAAYAVASSFRLRALLGNGPRICRQGNAYGERVPKEWVDEILSLTLKNESARQEIVLLLRERPGATIFELAEATGLATAEVLTQMTALIRKNRVKLDTINGTTPRYAALD